MTVSELGNSIRTILDTSQLGTPVNVRLQPQTALTIFGNHGIVRLNEGWVDPNSITETTKEHSWAADLQSTFGG